MGLQLQHFNQNILFWCFIFRPCVMYIFIKWFAFIFVYLRLLKFFLEPFMAVVSGMFLLPKLVANIIATYVTNSLSSSVVPLPALDPKGLSSILGADCLLSPL